MTVRGSERKGEYIAGAVKVQPVKASNEPRRHCVRRLEENVLDFGIATGDVLGSKRQIAEMAKVVRPSEGGSCCS